MRDPKTIEPKRF